MNCETILSEIRAERLRQDTKWGEQNHPSHAGMIGPGEIVNYRLPPAHDARALCDMRHKLGVGSWLDIAIEELAEANEAAFRAINPHIKDAEQGVRDELIQLAAVVVAWIECIDRRAEGTP